jgi:Iap family predicted aminopeptidase
MNTKTIKQIFRDTDFVHRSGTPEEKQVAEYLKARCEALGVEAHLEGFRVPMAEIEFAQVLADGKEIPCKGFYGCGSGEVEAELYYMPGQDKVSVAGAKDRIVLLDSQGLGRYLYEDLLKAGAKGILFQYGNVNWPQRDIDERDLREAVVADTGKKLLCAMLHSADAAALVKSGVKRVRISIKQQEYEGESHNVVAELPGETDEWIALTAHYDTTSLSHGAYDNMTGCVGLLGVMEALKNVKRRYGLRFVFCGSEERGLLGSKAYVRDHEAELTKTALNINLDMIGSIMGRFIACCSTEERLVSFLEYTADELGFPIAARSGVYSSDSTPFADKGVPSLSFARLAPQTAGSIHERYDTPAIVSPEQVVVDTEFIAGFTGRMANAVRCPVKREIPEKVKKELDEYLYRKRKEE